MLDRIHRQDIRQATIIDLEVGGNRGQPCWRNDAGAGIAETVDITPGLDRPVEDQRLLGQQIDATDGWMLRTNSIGVGCGHSCVIEKPARIFI